MRTKIGKFYVRRRADGTISKWTSIARSLRRDRAKKAVRSVRSGYGYMGDIRNNNLSYMGGLRI